MQKLWGLLILAMGVTIVTLTVFNFLKCSNYGSNQSSNESINHLTTKTMKKISPNMMVADVNATVDYYKNNLGFKTVMVIDEEKGDGATGKPLVWAMLKNGEVEIMLQRQDGFIAELQDMKGREIGGTFTLYISMQDTKDFYEKVKNKVEIVKDLHKTWYGADEFVIKDLNGYILYFAEVQGE
ncbi:MAG: VOC family protein [Candidatus Moraniibacteriota bacterium]|jgi:uncharacterized glyoxalase superfamily protein PhnB